MDVIDKFDGEYAWLSNFYPCEIDIDDGLIYYSVENAYQASKTLNRFQRLHIAQFCSPGQAKRYGRNVILREDWEDVKLEIMTDLVTQKFTKNLELLTKLLNTGESMLIEGNNWNDTYWGICNGKGENNLGKILMKIRKYNITVINKDNVWLMGNNLIF